MDFRIPPQKQPIYSCSNDRKLKDTNDYNFYKTAEELVEDLRFTKSESDSLLRAKKSKEAGFYELKSKALYYTSCRNRNTQTERIYRDIFNAKSTYQLNVAINSAYNTEFFKDFQQIIHSSDC